MEPQVLFAGIPVRDFVEALAWYERFFGRPADVVAHATEVMWRLTEGGWLHIVGYAQRAGSSIVALAVSDIEEVTFTLRERGVIVGPIEPEGDAGLKAVVVDPDGNSLALLEVAGSG